MSQEFTVSPIGLVTQPNKIGVLPVGAMSRADALCMRSPGKLTPFRTPSQLLTPLVLGAFTSCINITPTITGQLLVVSSTSGQATSTSQALGNQSTGAMTSVSIVESEVFLRARCRPFVFRGRLFGPLRTGLVVLDALDASDTTMRWAQLPQPAMLMVSLAGTPPANQTVGTATSLAAVIKRKFTDGYELISAPSAIIRNRAYSSTVEASGVQVTWGNNPARHGLLAGDIIEVYRSREVPAATDGLRVDPGTTLYKVASYTIPDQSTANAGSVSIPLYIAPGATGSEELYTNPGQESLQSVRLPPPIAKCAAEFKGFAFYGNCTLPGTWIAAVPGGWGNLPLTGPARTAGIGERQILTGTFTNGSPTITGVSAADMVGIKVGQEIYDAGTRIPTTPTVFITAVTASTITMSSNAISSGGPGTLTRTTDAVEINGVAGFTAGFTASLVYNLTSFGYKVVAAQTLMYNEGFSGLQPNNHAFDQQVSVSPLRATQFSNGITVRGSNGQNYVPPIPDMQTTALTIAQVQQKNLLQWSWEQQPEAVSPATYAFIGSGEIYVVATTRDVMWIFASDGLWRFTGYGTRPSGIQANWRVDQIDKTLIIAGPNAFAVLRDAVFAYTNIGLVKISDAIGVKPVSRGVIGDLIPGRYWVEDDDISMSADEVLDEVWLNINTGNFESGIGVSDCYVWSDTYGVFTKLNQSAGAADVLQQVAFDRVIGGMVFGVGRSSTSSPRIDFHNPAVASFSAWTADFLPQFGPDPAGAKQWGDMCFVSDIASAGKVITPRFNGVAYTGNPLVQYPQQLDSRAFFGVSQNAPAVANALAPGVSGASETTPTELRMVAMQYEPLDEQRVFR